MNSISGSVLADLEAELEPDEEIRARTEGGRKVIISTRVERDPSLRSAAIRLHGTQCVVCKFEFGQVYGEWGEGFIEVHHIVPLGDDDVTSSFFVRIATGWCIDAEKKYWMSRSFA